MKSTINMRKVMRNSFRLYFAPLTGAFKGIRDEVRRTDREISKRVGEDRNRETAKHA